MAGGSWSVCPVSWTLCSRCVWMYFLLVNLQLSAVLSEMCVYRTSKFNSLTDRYDKLITTTDCQWGCCYTSGSPCCTAPVSLIVGVVLGSVLILAMIVAVLCCCCVCRKQQQRGGRVQGGAPPRGGQRDSVVFHTETSDSTDNFDVLPYNDAPPSYEEVMSGQINHAFKPETS